MRQLTTDDLIERRNELRAKLEKERSTQEYKDYEIRYSEPTGDAMYYEYNIEEIDNIENEIGKFPDIAYQLIPVSDFADYLEGMFVDAGIISKGASNIIVIDWESTCEKHEDDYTMIEYEGENYYVRNY